MKSDPAEIAVYLVHLWPTHAVPQGFRASVRRVDRDEPEVFTEAVRLADYFEQEARLDCDEPTSTPPRPVRDQPESDR
jgi:hypothetical protein